MACRDVPFQKTTKKSAFENKIIFGSRIFFSEISISEMGVRMNFSMLRKNHAADPEIGFRKKSSSKPHGLTWPCRQRGS